MHDEHGTDLTTTGGETPFFAAAEPQGRTGDPLGVENVHHIQACTVIETTKTTRLNIECFNFKIFKSHAGKRLTNRSRLTRGSLACTPPSSKYAIRWRPLQVGWRPSLLVTANFFR